MNTLLQTKFDGEKYSFCDTLENEEKCQLCVIPIVFCNFERGLNNNKMNSQYLQKYLSKLYPYLSKLLYVNKELICCFLHKEYCYRVIDQSGRRYYMFLLEIIKVNQKAELDKIKQKFY